MKNKKHKGFASKTTSENKAFLEKEDKESKEIANEFKKGTKISKKF